MVESAIAAGYRHIDTAAMYDNEAAVGNGIVASGIARGDLFVTTKVWHEQLAPDALRKAFDTSLAKLKLDYVRQALEDIGAPIAALQVEYHPFIDQSAMLNYLRPRGIPLTAYVLRISIVGAGPRCSRRGDDLEFSADDPMLEIEGARSG
ncbi:MAG TPA: aldo/keto reductase [Bradyrhizobium sp.]